MDQLPQFQFGNPLDFQSTLELYYNLRTQNPHIIRGQEYAATLSASLIAGQNTISPEWALKGWILYHTLENNVSMAFRLLDFSFLLSHTTAEDYQKVLNLIRAAAIRSPYEPQLVFCGRVFSFEETLKLFEYFHQGSYPSDESIQHFVNEMNASRLNEQVITPQQIEEFFILFRAGQNFLASLLGSPHIHFNGLEARQIGIAQQNLNVNGIGVPLLTALHAIYAVILPAHAFLNYRIVYIG